MQVHIPKGLAFGCCPGSLRPLQLFGAFIVKGTFQLRPDEPVAWAEEPALVTGDLHEDGDPSKPLSYPSDFALFKPRTDLIVVGSARAPQGQRVSTLRTGFSVGAFAKVFDLRSTSGPFSEMPLTHRWIADPPPLPKQRAKLPEPVLAGFGPIPASWPQRSNLAGTYDDAYVKERWPWFPKDFDYGYFNAAPRDQQLDSYLRGDEDIVLQHLHPEHAMLRTTLPGLRVRCFIQVRAANGELRYSEPQMRLDTLWIDVDAAKLVLVWRGLAEMRTPKMREVQRVMVVTEPLTQAPRPAAEYVGTLLDVPEEPDAAASAEEAASKLKFAQLEIAMAEMGKLIAANEADLAEAEQQIEAHAAAAIAELPLGTVLPTSPAPAPSAAEVAAQIKVAFAEIATQDPTLDAVAAAIDADEFVKAEAEFAAMAMAAAEFDSEMNPDVWTRERVLAAATARTPMTDLDLGGLDLSGLDLSDQNLSGSRLIGANLAGTLLVRTKLVGTDLTAATLAGANLTEAVLDRADLSASDLGGATLTKLSLNRTRLAGLNLAGADLSGSVGKEPNFAKANLANACLAGVHMPSADFTESTLDQADFTGAVLSNASFCGASASGADFTGANADGLQADEEANFEGGCFRCISAQRAVFDTSNLDSADFGRARLIGAQFEGASMRGANFDRADLTGAMFDDAMLQRAVLRHANLLRASLEGADLTGALADGANAFEAGFWRAIGASAAFAHASRKSTLIE